MTPNNQIQTLCHQMKLLGIQSNFERRASEAVAGGLHPLEFLELLLQDESLQRKDRFSKSLQTRAKFRTQSVLEDWDSTFDRGVSREKLRELGHLGFYHNQENLIILGRTGEGKTHLAIALGRRLCVEGISVGFLPVNILFEEILAARASGKYLGYIRKLGQTKALILDDFGLRGYSHEEASALVDILEDRSRKGPVIVTSQVEPKGWLKLFEDPVIAEAIVDRLEHPSQRVTLKGGSYREKLQSKMTKTKPVAQTKKEA